MSTEEQSDERIEKQSEERNKSPFKALVFTGFTLALLGLGATVYFIFKASPAKKELDNLLGGGKPRPSVKNNSPKLSATKKIDNEPITKLAKFKGFLSTHRVAIITISAIIVSLIAYGIWCYLEELEQQRVAQELLDKQRAQELLENQRVQESSKKAKDLGGETVVKVSERVPVLYRIMKSLIYVILLGAAHKTLKLFKVHKYFTGLILSTILMPAIYIGSGTHHLIWFSIFPGVQFICIALGWSRHEIPVYIMLNYLMKAIIFTMAIAYSFVNFGIEYSILAFGFSCFMQEQIANPFN